MWSCRGELFSRARHSSEWWSFLYLPPPLYSIPLCPWQWTKRSVVPLAAFGARCAPCLSSALIYSCYFPLQRQALICAPPSSSQSSPSPSHHTSQCVLLPIPLILRDGGGVVLLADGIWLASSQSGNDGTELPLKSITWVNVFIRGFLLKLTHQHDDGRCSLRQLPSTSEQPLQYV